MMKNGARPTKRDKRDFDYHKSFPLKVGATTLPQEFWTDAGLTMPDQTRINTYFTPPVPALPEGCTDYTQAEVATDFASGKTIYNPEDLENVTHANAAGGYDVRQSLLAAKKLGWIKDFYRILATVPLDFFLAFQLAQYSGSPEMRSISFCTPWFPSWEAAIGRGEYLMPMPTSAELSLAFKDPEALPWHNSKLAGWKLINGYVMYGDKSWQGTSAGQGGIVFFTREVINTTMTIPGTSAFIPCDAAPASVQTIDPTIVEVIVSIIRKLLGMN